MGIKDIFKKASQEGEVIKGEKTKDKFYSSQQDFPDEQSATEAFAHSKEKLFHVDGWSELHGLSSAFELFDAQGKRKPAGQAKTGDYIRIDLPGPTPENWVHITGVRVEENLAEFTVHPSEDPQKRKDDPQIEHFFIKEASSTFRVERQGKRLIASEIGKNEGINNQGEEAGSRSVINTLVAEGGWAFFQESQWKKLTSYLVHLKD